MTLRIFSASAAAQRQSNRQQQQSLTEEAAESSVNQNDVSPNNQISKVRPVESFADLGISPFLVDALSQISITRPSDIQKNCIPQILAGRNVIGAAKTGSGKTMAFALPIIQQLSADPYGIFALILTPTRELAYQIGEQFRIIGESIRLKQSIIVGGVDMMRQALELSRKPHIVIATPGRLADMIRSSADAVCFDKIRFLVLDEADRLLEETFAEHMSEILACLPKKRQSLLFSATITGEIESLCTEKTYMYKAHNRYDTVEKLEQRYIITPSLVRDAYLIWILQNLEPKRTAIVFTNKCKTCEILRLILREMGINATALHSQMPQYQRISSLAKFHSNQVPILLTTDIGSRGLDIPMVHTVINYDVPSNATDYIHRVGRTSRANRSGRAITLVTEHDVNLILNIESRVGKKMEAEPVPEKEINDMLLKTGTAKRMAAIRLEETRFGEKTAINRKKRQI